MRKLNPGVNAYPSALWTRQAVQDLIKQRIGIRLPIRTVGEYLRRWGFTPQKPVRKAYKQDPEAVATAIAHVLDDFERHARLALSAASRWGMTMGADRMVDAMLAQVAARTLERSGFDRIAA